MIEQDGVFATITAKSKMQMAKERIVRLRTRSKLRQKPGRYVLVDREWYEPRRETGKIRRSSFMNEKKIDEKENDVSTNTKTKAIHIDIDSSQDVIVARVYANH